MADIFDFDLETLLSCISLTPNLTHYTYTLFASSHRTPPFVPERTRDRSALRICLPVTSRLVKSLLNILTPGYLDDEERRWPQLQHIEIKEAAYIPDMDVLDFIHGRMRSGDYVPLKFVRFHFQSRDMATDILSSLSNYTETKGGEMLKVNFVYSDPIIFQTGTFCAQAGLMPRMDQGL